MQVLADRETMYYNFCDLIDKILIESGIREVCIKCATGVEPYEERWFEPPGCCDGCKHLTNTGCSIKSLSCKLWLCGPKLRDKLSDDQKMTLTTISRIATHLGMQILRGNPLNK